MVDSKQSLQANPTDKMVYYLEQHSTILSQISQQIASIAPQVSIPSIPPPPFPAFSPSASDIRINAFWFMALAFSLSAALLATLVQQWVRDYMHVFQRYSDPQKSARMRQYLNDGSEGWYMPVVAEAVPGLLHVSLFLFLAGLADYTLHINTTIGLSTTVPIGICGLLYIFITLAPVIYPQSPYQTSYSGVIWYAVQKLRGRRYKDRDGELKSVSTNMAQGQMQLSMEGTMDREGRDKRAILWLMDNLTEDAEIESFVMSMPGSLQAWADLSKKEVTCIVSEPALHLRTIHKLLGLVPRRFKVFTASRSSTNAMVHRPASHSVSTHRSIVASNYEKTTIREFCWRIGHFFGTCKNRAVFASDELWRMRSRACVEAMASLVSFADVEVGWFGDTLEALGDIGNFEGTCNLSLSDRDQAFAVQWKCLSIMAIRSTIKSTPRRIDLWLDRFSNGSIVYADPLWNARTIDKTLEDHWGIVREGGLSSNISFAVGIMRKFNRIINSNMVEFDEVIQRITRQLPGVDIGFPDSEPFLRQSLDLFRDPAKLRFISSQQPLHKFFDYLERVDGYRSNLPTSEDVLKHVIENVFWPKYLLQRRLWSIGDLHHGGLGFAVELFLLSLRQLLSASPSQRSYSVLYIGTFKAITSDWREYDGSLGTHKILLDIVASDQGFLRTFDYPDYITDEVWQLLGDLLEAYTHVTHTVMKRTLITSDVNDVVRRLADLEHEDGGRYRARASALISRLRALSTQ